MIINPVQQFNELTATQKQKQEMEAIEEKKADQADQQNKARKEEELKPPDQKPTMVKEQLGRIIDTTV